MVAACCYIARTYGVPSAMPMFMALKACPDAVVVKPDMKKYTAVGGEPEKLLAGEIALAVLFDLVAEHALARVRLRRNPVQKVSARIKWLIWAAEVPRGLQATEVELT